MRRLTQLTAALALVASALTMGLAAGKTTVDPNTVTKVIKAAAPVGAADKRLDAKITYDAAGVRLHEVISEIARVTGATIYCGSSPEDWRARDIPITVAARDIPARKLLDFVTYATQTSFIEVKIEKSEFYRVVRNAKLQKKCDDYLAAKEGFNKVHAQWSLDMACRLKDIPLSDIKEPKGSFYNWSIRLAPRIEISKLLSALDADTKKAILAGEKLILSPRTAPAGLRGPLLAVLQSMDVAYVKDPVRLGFNLSTATAGDLQNARLGLSLNGASILVSTVVVASTPDGTFDPPRGLSELASDVSDIVLANADPSTLPKQPTRPSLPEIGDLSGAKEIWDSPEGAEKVTVKLEADGKLKFGGDALIALSKASNLTIVCEDFETVHKERDVAASVGEASTVYKVLASAFDGIRWSAQGKSKAIIGTSSNWVQELRHLIPQRVFDDLTAKADGDGVDLEDLTGLMGLSVDFRDYWFRGETFEGRPFDVLDYPDAKAIWSFYGSLPQWEKELAKSDAGLPLNRYDAKLVAGMLKDKIKAIVDWGALHDFGSADGAGIGAASGYSRMLEPAVLPTLVMRLKTSEAVYPTFVRPNPPPSVSASSADETKTKSDKPMKIPPGFFKRLDYYILIEGVDARNKISLQVSGPYRLPFFSPRREKELNQAVADQKGPAHDVPAHRGPVTN